MSGFEREASSHAAARPMPMGPDQLAAHDLLTELRTRIAVQRLPYQHGIEARALESLWEIFGFARKAMKDHPGCEIFARAATEMLNVQLRPVTAKWHRAHKAGLLDTRDGADAFRADLEITRQGLAEFALRLQDMAYGHRQPDAPTPPVIDPCEVTRCFAPLRFGIAEDGDVAMAAEMNFSEASEIAKRRALYGINTQYGTDAVGLALSGGGIRSATFCLGVVQVLAEKGLMPQVDYLSTVSGGGYTGSFITSRIGGGRQFDDLARPHGPDTELIKHVRQNAKYLSAADLKEKWLIVTGTLAGMVLNWTGPLSLIGIFALSVAWAGADTTEALGDAVGCLGLLTLTLLLPYGWLLRSRRWSRTGIEALAGCSSLAMLAVVLMGIEAGYRVFRHALAAPLSVAGLTAAAISLPSIFLFMATLRSRLGKRAVLRALTLAAGIAVPLLAVVCYYMLRRFAELPADPGASLLAPQHYLSGAWLVALGTMALGLFAMFGVDVNATGPHKIYRDALARTFVQSSHDEPDIQLSSVNSGCAAPYHLINATVNLPSSRSPVLRDRRGDFFLMSKFWTGSPSTGYHATENWRIGRQGLGLATAMAISGAAASPHMGLGSKPTLSALLTLLNIRLGLWVPRPGRAGARIPGFTCLLREMTGVGMSEKSSWLNLSDGGHIENMGVYELLRRRCKFIVCVDGEADPEFTFHGQLTLVRHAQIDLGIRLEPRFDDIRLSAPSGYSRSHSQMLRIVYPAEGSQRPAAVGLMLYLKLSLTGNEAELLQRYRKLHPDFPHQPTTDQFYDEEQFEAYRQLGVHIAEGAFSPALLTSGTTPASIAAWFRELAENMLEPDAT